MPEQRPVFLSWIEAKGLWVRATGGDTSRDPVLDQGAEDALAKVYQAELDLRNAERRLPAPEDPRTWRKGEGPFAHEEGNQPGAPPPEEGT
jgi:hypothetical protein